MAPEDDYPMTYEDELREAQEKLEWASFLATSSSLKAVRELPGMGDRAVDIHDPYFSADEASVRLSHYYDPYSGHYTTGVVVAVTGDDWSLRAATGEPVTIQRAAAELSVEPSTLQEAADLLRGGLQAGWDVWRENSPDVAVGAEGPADSPTRDGGPAEVVSGRASNARGMESPDAAAQRRLAQRDHASSPRHGAGVGVGPPPAGRSR